ncbi:MAG TPA: FmdB family transcriptional regulator [Opitutaceae bacterium]|nr:FmdB family transcriptional regulator [Opitutaceae bacterium]
MPIYEFYCPDNHRIYQFFAKTLAQGRTIPKCPDNPAFRLEKLVSNFAVTGSTKRGKSDTGGEAAGGAAEADDPRMEAAMKAMEGEFANVDENDPRAMGRMMRRMAELTGEKIDGEMEEVVRKLEEGADPESMEEQFGGAEGGEQEFPGGADPAGGQAGGEPKEGRHRFRARRGAPIRDPKLYEYE